MGLDGDNNDEIEIKVDKDFSKKMNKLAIQKEKDKQDLIIVQSERTTLDIIELVKKEANKGQFTISYPTYDSNQEYVLKRLRKDFGLHVEIEEDDRDGDIYYVTWKDL